MKEYAHATIIPHYSLSGRCCLFDDAIIDVVCFLACMSHILLGILSLFVTAFPSLEGIPVFSPQGWGRNASSSLPTDGCADGTCRRRSRTRIVFFSPDVTSYKKVY